MKRCITTLAISLLLISPALAQVPQKILDEMHYLVGQWQTEGTFEGKAYRGIVTVQWEPGQRCLAGRAEGTAVDGSSITGWDAASKEIAVTAYRADGARVEIRYNDIRPDAWFGTVRVTDAVGKTASGTVQLEKTKDGYTEIGQAGDAKVVLKNRRLAAGDKHAVHQRWLKYLSGSWSFEYPALGIKGDNEYRPAAEGAAVVATGSSSNGSTVELIGSRADTQRMVFSGYGSKGNYWHAECADIGERRIAGTTGGTLPDGRELHGTMELVRIDDNRFEVRIAGGVAGQKLTDTGVFTRKK